MGSVDHFTASELASGYTIIFAYLHHICNTVRGEVVNRDTGHFINILETEIDMGGTQGIHVKPDISWPAVFNEVFILVLVSTDVAYDVFGF